MKSYLDLVKQYGKMHRRESRVTVICIAIAVCLVTAIFGMADMEVRSQRIRMIHDSGNWHVCVKDASDKKVKKIKEDLKRDIKVDGWLVQYQSRDLVKINGTEFAVAGAEEDMSDAFGVGVEAGSFPTAVDEVMMDRRGIEEFGVQLGDTIAADLPNGQNVKLKVTGYFENTEILKKDGANALIFTQEGMKQYFDKKDYSGYYYIQFKAYANMRKDINLIKENYHLKSKQVGENTGLLATTAQSDDSYMMQLYGTAGVLFVLVLLAGVFMIAGTFNLNIRERTQFFGMLRCLGASKRQIKRFVRKECFLYCLRALPIGIISGVLICQGSCFFLRTVNPDYFAEMPVIAISGISILCGILVGVLTVWIAAMSPCRKAAKVSPVAAVGGLAQQSKSQFHKGRKRTMVGHVDTVLGFSHAVGLKKNLFLMTGSFALSIIMFLSFHVLVDFMHHGINAMEPWTPDFSVISKDNTLSIPQNNLEEIAALDGVKKAYGRKFAYEVEGTYEKQALKADVLTYEKYQLDWAKDYIQDGDLERIKTDTGTVLVEYDLSGKWKVGETITLNINNQDVNLEIAGILSSTPFQAGAGENLVICSEDTFEALYGASGYTILDIQIEKNAPSNLYQQIRKIVGKDVTLSDMREGNQSAKAAYYSFAIFIYGFLGIIALITIFNIVNSMNMSILSRGKQYGIMRAVGMSAKQVRKMVYIEAITYGICGCIVGCILGLPLNRAVFLSSISYHWGTEWTVPIGPLAVIILIVLGSVVLSVQKPCKRIRDMDIVDSINTLG